MLERPDLDRLPIPTCWPGDGGPFITLPLVFTKDPRTGGRNVGMYRLQKYDATSTGLHWQIHKDAAADWRDGAGRMEVAISIGSDPITAYAGSCPAPKHVDELMFAGFLRGKPVEIVQCKTVDLQVPARAEIVLEGYFERGELAAEGPFGDHTGYYTPAEPFPVLRLTGMTMRRDAIYPSILVGPPPTEDAWLGKATERIFLPPLRTTLPELVDYDLPVEGAFHNCCIVSIRKSYPGTRTRSCTRSGARACCRSRRWSSSSTSGSTCTTTAQVAWQVGANVDPGPRRRAGARPARPARPRAFAAVARRQARARRDEDVARRGLPARVARGRAHERRGAPRGSTSAGTRSGSISPAGRRRGGAQTAPRMAPLVAVLGASRFLGRLAIPISWPRAGAFAPSTAVRLRSRACSASSATGPTRSTSARSRARPPIAPACSTSARASRAPMPSRRPRRRCSQAAPARIRVERRGEPVARARGRYRGASPSCAARP